MDRPLVTRKEFEQITCNRCGACCEVVWQPSPLNMAILLGRNAVPGDYMSWWSDLEPVLTSEANDDQSGGLQRYRCLRFERDANGVGFCTQYASRPTACASFPDGQPVHGKGFEACSWNVSIVEEDGTAELR